MGFFDSITNSIKKPLGAKLKTPEELYGENLIRLMDVALCDGVLTRKERELLINSAKADNRDVEAFTKYLDETIASRKITITNEQQAVEFKTSRLGGKASQLQTLVDLALSDGEISVAERAMLSEEARKLRLSVQDFNRVLDLLISQTKQQHVDWTKSVIETMTSIDYDMVLKGLAIASAIPPIKVAALVVTPIVLILKGAAIEYNKSTDTNRDSMYLTYLWNSTSPTHIIDAIKPVEKYVPYSGIIIKGAEALAPKQN